MDASTLAQSVGMSFEERCWDAQATGAVLNGYATTAWQLPCNALHVLRSGWLMRDPSHAACSSLNACADALEEQQNETNPAAGRSDAEASPHAMLLPFHAGYSLNGCRPRVLPT